MDTREEATNSKPSQGEPMNRKQSSQPTSAGNAAIIIGTLMIVSAALSLIPTLAERQADNDVNPSGRPTDFFQVLDDHPMTAAGVQSGIGIFVIAVGIAVRNRFEWGRYALLALLYCALLIVLLFGFAFGAHWAGITPHLEGLQLKAVGLLGIVFSLVLLAAVIAFVILLITLLHRMRLAQEPEQGNGPRGECPDRQESQP